MIKYPKSIKRKLQMLVDKAYENELTSHMEKLYQNFIDWKNNKISNEKMNKLIHQYHDSESKQIYHRYRYTPLGSLVAYAIVKGYLDEDEVPEELHDYINDALSYFREMKQKGL